MIDYFLFLKFIVESNKYLTILLLTYIHIYVHGELHTICKLIHHQCSIVEEAYVFINIIYNEKTEEYGQHNNNRIIIYYILL